MTTGNEIWINTGQQLERLDLFEDTALLVTYQSNDRTKPDSIQSDYSPEFEAPANSKNARLLNHAASNQTLAGQPYKRIPVIVKSAGIETLPSAILLVKSYTEGRYQLQLLGGNRRLVDALKRADGTDKTLADLDFSRFDHAYTPANVLARLPYDHWKGIGYGYELFDRGKPLDLQAVDPYSLYPSVSYRLVLEQVLADAGFTATDLLAEPLLAALNVPAPNAFTFPDKFREARALKAGYTYQPDPQQRYFYYHDAGFAEEKLVFAYVVRRPYHAPEAGTGSTYQGGTFTAGTLGFYDLVANVPCWVGLNSGLPGKVRVRFQLKVIFYT